ncbi:MAG: hypothetical protein ACYST6_03410 [Planctomycetota bacterium]|jgi:hypothetical protein
MRKARFTRKDVLVVIGTIAFVLANLAAVGRAGRMRAKEAVCLSNVLKWGQAWKAYADDHDGYFPPRGGGASWGEETMGAWPMVMRDYCPSLYPRIYLCPMATKPMDEGGRCPYAAWWLETYAGLRTAGSYCANYWVAKDQYPQFWRTPYVADAGKVPLVLDGSWKDVEPLPSDDPPPSREWIQAMCWEPNANEMKRVCQYRHESMVNGVFLDLSGRKIGLKELWVLKWHREWPEGNDHLPDWEVAAPWMENFKDY